MWETGLAEVQDHHAERHFLGEDYKVGRPLPVVTVDGTGVVSHAGTALLRELADRSGLTGGYSTALAGLGSCRGGHDPGRVAVDVAVVIADGGEVISELRALPDQELLHGPVASTATGVEYSIGFPGADPRRAAISRVPAVAWAPAVAADG